MRIRGSLLRDVDIRGELDGLRLNGIDVVPLIEAARDLDALEGG